MILLSSDTERIRYENKFLINFGTVLFSYLTFALMEWCITEKKEI